MTTTPNTTQAKIINDFLARPIHIYGAVGAEGSAVLVWLFSQGHTQLIAHDVVEPSQALVEWQRVHESESPTAAEQFSALLQNSKIDWRLGDKYDSAPAAGEIFFVPQSWFRYERNNFLRPFFTAANAVRPEFMGEVWTLTRLYFALFPGTLLAVTGSDGKTTTTRMLTTILQAHVAERGGQCIESGNDRTHAQALAVVAAAAPTDYLILEISDRQLSFGFPFKSDAAIVTNITPNKHMDDYGGLAAYTAVKGNLIRWQSANQFSILNADDKISRENLASLGQGQKLWISLKARPEAGGWCDGTALYLCDHRNCEQLINLDELQVIGEHNWYNALAAAVAARAVGVAQPTIKTALSSFSGVPHRLQPIRTWQQIDFIEDSAGGNPINVATSIRTFKNRPLILLIGGYRPNLTATEIEAVIKALLEKNSVHTLVLFGAVALRFQELLQAAGVNTPIKIVENLPTALAWIKQQQSELNNLQRPVVCLTPGFESFDQYKDYRVRAAHFVSLVNDL